MSGRLSFVRGNALTIPLADKSVALIVTSPPYFGLRSYRDEGEHFDGQLGSEPTPFLFLANLWATMDEAWRVLRDDGNAWINLGDKYCNYTNGSGKGRNVGGGERSPARVPDGPVSAPTIYGLRAKTRMALPHRFYEGCIDPEYRASTEQRAGFDRSETERRLTLTPGDGGYPQWVGRLDVVWSKKSGMPESVTDRCRASHENWFHLTKEERYFSAVDEIREPHSEVSLARSGRNRFAPDLSQQGVGTPNTLDPSQYCHSLGKAPGSVWEFPSEPLVGVPEFMVLDDPDSLHPTEYLRSAADAWAWTVERGVDCSAWPRSAGVGPQLYAMPDHFAAFGSQMVKRIILGWSPSGVCVACGDPRRPVVGRRCDCGAIVEAHTKTCTACGGRRGAEWKEGRQSDPSLRTAEHLAGLHAPRNPGGFVSTAERAGYACSCPTPTAPTTPACVLDPFSGTGTTAIGAAALGRHGIGVELSADYLRLARWRDEDGGLRCKALGVEKPPKQVRGQDALF